MNLFSQPSLSDHIATIEANAANLSEKDQFFAASLCAQASRKTLTDKQAFWLAKIAERALAGPQKQERTKTAIGDLSGVAALFDRARKHLKKPAIVLQIDGQEYRLAYAGAKARVPGSINVAENGRFGEAEWFGRILADGQFEASPRATAPAGLIDGLQRFAASPAEVAAEHGKLTGKCCFCNIRLTDPRSTAVGYGSTCAKNFGLAWGAKSGASLFSDAA
jgi:hypothetical protein